MIGIEAWKSLNDEKQTSIIVVKGDASGELDRKRSLVDNE